MSTGPLDSAFQQEPTLRMVRKPSDFEHVGHITPFTGTGCCCCCCLHWIGAAVGGLIGLRLGWTDASKRLTFAPESRSTLHVAWVTGLLGAPLTFAILGGCEYLWGAYFTAVPSSVVILGTALLPFFAFGYSAIGLMLVPYVKNRLMYSRYRAEVTKQLTAGGQLTEQSLYRLGGPTSPAVDPSPNQLSCFCEHCWGNVDNALETRQCPHCDKPIVYPQISGPDYGLAGAWQMTKKSILLSALGTFIGYVVMIIIAFLSAL